MKILMSNQIREADAYTIKNEPIKSIDLMERAARTATDWIIKKFGNKHKFVVFAGPGNNGGDGLAIARMLLKHGYQVETFFAKITDKCSIDFQANQKRLEKLIKKPLKTISTEKDIPDFDEDDILIDALFGSGLTRPLKGDVVGIVKHMNQAHNDIISIDIPSGLFGEDNYTPYHLLDNNDSQKLFKNLDKEKRISVKAKYTLTFELPFLSFFFPENASYVGDVVELPIGLHKNFLQQVQSQHNYYTHETIAKKIITRNKHSHKGNYGHALLVAGSSGKIGAAVLASKACLRSGAGLLTSHIPQTGNQILQTTIPEAMVSLDPDSNCLSQIPDISPYNAIGMGPGLGMDLKSQTALKELLAEADCPLVVDADAINIIANHKDWMNKVPINSIFTPHPKEFERLVGNTTDDLSRNRLQVEFAKKYKIIVVLKGAYTCIATPEGNCYFNSTGNPGMATAGSGDALTGIILALLAQGYAPENAAIVGVHVHGLAGDIAGETSAYESIIASDIIENLGTAFKRLLSLKLG